MSPIGWMDPCPWRQVWSGGGALERIRDQSSPDTERPPAALGAVAAPVAAALAVPAGGVLPFGHGPPSLDVGASGTAVLAATAPVAVAVGAAVSDAVGVGV